MGWSNVISDNAMDRTFAFLGRTSVRAQSVRELGEAEA